MRVRVRTGYVCAKSSVKLRQLRLGEYVMYQQQEEEKKRAADTIISNNRDTGVCPSFAGNDDDDDNVMVCNRDEDIYDLKMFTAYVEYIEKNHKYQRTVIVTQCALHSSNGIQSKMEEH